MLRRSTLAAQERRILDYSQRILEPTKKTTIIGAKGVVDSKAHAQTGRPESEIMSPTYLTGRAS
jgi:hypothetical protein